MQNSRLLWANLVCDDFAPLVKVPARIFSFFQVRGKGVAPHRYRFRTQDLNLNTTLNSSTNTSQQHPLTTHTTRTTDLGHKDIDEERAVQIRYQEKRYL